MKRLRLSRFGIVALVIALVAILLGVALTVNWLSKNTSTFTSNISQQDLDKNNRNLLDAPFKLQPQTLGDRQLLLPAGFSISEYATEIDSARFFAFNNKNTMFVGTKNNDKIYAIPQNEDGSAGDPIVIDSGLDTPHSVFFYKKDLYVGEHRQVSVYRDIKNDGTYSQKDILVDNLPSGNTLTGGGHTTRTVAIGPDEKLYVSIGSSCNVCEEDDERRAAIVRYNLDGSGENIFATGLRNSVGFDFDENGDMYAVDNGRDRIGDDSPSEEVNLIEKGNDYGWPYCYGNGENNPEFPDREGYCSTETTFPVLNMQAHSAPLGMEFVNTNIRQNWPENFKDGFFTAFHGSWNRTIPTGYKIVWVDLSGEQPRQYNFITGWLESNAEAWGRPVDVGFDNDGSMYITDDKQGKIYKVTYDSET